MFYLNELIKVCKQLPGVQINGDIEINMLLYADDLVIIGDNVGRVQRILNKLSQFCQKWGLAVNTKKTKAMIFRNGGIVKSTERFYLDGNVIENVSHYKYLGLPISTDSHGVPVRSIFQSKQIELHCHCQTPCTSAIIHQK